MTHQLHTTATIRLRATGQILSSDLANKGKQAAGGPVTGVAFADPLPPSRAQLPGSFLALIPRTGPSDVARADAIEKILWLLHTFPHRPSFSKVLFFIYDDDRHANDYSTGFKLPERSEVARSNALTTFTLVQLPERCGHDGDGN